MGRAAAFGIALVLGTAALSSAAGAAGTPDLSLTASASLGFVNSGQPLTYTLLVQNLSFTDSATNVTVVDTLPAGATFSSATAGCTQSAGVVTCTAATLAAGSSRVFQITVTAPIVSGPMPPNPSTSNPPAAPLAPPITNTATVSADEPDPSTANNTATVSTYVFPVTDLSLTKTGPATATPGSTIAFTIRVTNNGPSDARWVLVYDPLPAGTVAVGSGMTSPDSPICGQEVATPSFPSNPHVGEYGCRFTSIAVGATVTMKFTVRIVTSTLPTISNTATAYAGLNTTESLDVDPNPTNNAATATVAIAQSADVSVGFAPPVPTTVGTNEQFTYSIAVANSGPSAATNVVVTQDLPPSVTLVSAPAFCAGTQQLTCALGNLPGGLTTAPFPVVVRAPGTPGSISSTASVTASEPDPNPTNNSVTLSTNVVVRTAEVSLTKSGGPTTVGAPATYTITAHNNGPDDATNVVVNDPLVAGLSYGVASWRIGATSHPCVNALGTITCSAPALAAGADMVVTIPVTANAAGTVLNKAAVIADQFDPNTANNIAERTTTVRGLVDLALVKTDAGGAPHVEGGQVIYSLTVTNSGPHPANGVTITDTLPPGTSFASGSASCSPTGATVTCGLGTIPSGGSSSVLITVNVSTTGTLTNTATVTTTDTDTNSANDTASATSTIFVATDLAAAESAATGASGTAEFTTTVTNNGPSVSHGALAFTALPAGASAAAVSSPNTLICGLETTGLLAGKYGCRFGAIAVGGSVTMVFSFQPPSGAASTSATVTAYPGSGEFDLNGANDSATASLALGNTPAGTNVAVAPTDPATGTSPMTVTFSNVTGAGETTLTTSSSGPTPPPGFTGFLLGTTYYDLHTTATFTGTVRVCITDPSVTAATRLFHYETNPAPPPPQTWVDRTVLPVTPPIICADVTSFSLFAAFVDTTPPTIAITRPSGTYPIGAVVLASYTCADAGSGVATCVGTRANGAAVDTATAGTKTFTVDATDKAGNTAHQTVTYTVGYGICAAPRGSSPVDGARVLVRICDAAGQDLSSATVVLTALGLDGGPLPSTGQRPATFQFVPGQHAYEYVVPAGRLAPGTHTLRFAVAGDPATHDVSFVVRR